MRKPRQQGIQSIEVGHALLAALATAPSPLMLKELAKTAGMSAPKAHRYLVSFMRMGLVEQEQETGLYDLGPFALELGLAALGRLDPIAVAGKFLRDLGEELNQTVALAVWANRGATIVRWVGADSPVSATLRVGSVMPLTRSATGLMFLALLPHAQTEVLLKKELAQNARQGLQPQSSAALDSTLRDVRRSGFARTDGFIPGITGIAAPVYDTEGTVVLALVTLGYSGTFASSEPQIRAALMKTAESISSRLGAKLESRQTAT
jgi:DNA-binding IclR family transcriptional regulator